MGVFTDLVSGMYTTGHTYIAISATNLIGAVVYTRVFEPSGLIPSSFADIHLLLLAGGFSTLGGIAYYEAIEHSGDSTGVVVTVSALYFVLAAVLLWFFTGDSLSPVGWVGVGFVSVGVVLVSYF